MTQKNDDILLACIAAAIVGLGPFIIVLMFLLPG